VFLAESVHAVRRTRSCLLAAVGATLLIAFVAAGAQAEEPPPEAKWGFSGNLGTGGAGGDFGNLFREPISGELDFFRLHGAWRFGVGVSYGSFGMQEPYQDEQEWGFLQTYLFATRMLRTEGAVRPYIQLRGGLARLHPRSFLFAETPLPDDLEPGDSPTKPANGFSVGVVPGLELRLGRAFSLDASLSYSWFKTDAYDLSPVKWRSSTSAARRSGSTTCRSAATSRRGRSARRSQRTTSWRSCSTSTT